MKTFRFYYARPDASWMLESNVTVEAERLEIAEFVFKTCYPDLEIKGTLETN